MLNEKWNDANKTIDHNYNEWQRSGDSRIGAMLMNLSSKLNILKEMITIPDVPLHIREATGPIPNDVLEAIKSLQSAYVKDTWTEQSLQDDLKLVAFYFIDRAGL